MGRRCAFSARKRREARRPVLRDPRVNPDVKDSAVVSRRRRSKGMPRRGAVEGGFAMGLGSDGVVEGCGRSVGGRVAILDI